MTNSSQGSDEVQAGRQLPALKRRWRWLLLVPVLALIAVAVLLDRLPELLITEERWDKADYVLVLGGSGCLQEAAAWYREGRAERVLLIGCAPAPVVSLGILPTYEDATRLTLLRAGVAPQAIVLIPASAHNTWDTARALGPWLHGHPQLKLDVICDRLLSGRDRFVLRSLLTPEQAASLRFFGLPDPQVVERGWWRHRSTLKSVAITCLLFAFDYLHGPPSASPPPSESVVYARAVDR